MGAEGAEPGGLSVVEGGTIPYLPAALEKKKQNAANTMTLDPYVKCYLPGVPRATYMPYPFQIFQSEKAMAIAYEYDGAFRNIYLKDPGPAPVDSWMGQSYGKWEGDTLVVDVTGLDERTWFDRAGDFTATRCTWWSATRCAIPEYYGMRRPLRTEGVFEAVENQHAALQACGEERAASGIQVRGVRGRPDVRAIQQKAEGVMQGGPMSVPRFKFAGVCAMVSISTIAPAAFGQTAQKPAGKWTMPRLADGHPDLQGIWTNATITTFERPAQFKDKPTLTEPEAVAYRDPGRYPV